ncbi:hypothetical protein AOLI_G00213860 [Acnodon oligacanthus]
MEEDSDRNYNPATGTCGSQSSGVNIHMHVGSGATVFAPYLTNVQAKDITFSQNNAGARQSGGERDITSVIAEYKKSLVAEHVCIREYTSRPGEHVLLADRYVDPLIIQRHREKKEKKEEIRSKGEDFHHARTYHIDHHITVDKLFSQEDSPNGVPPKAVILQGNSGSGKSFTAQKILYDWANGNLFAGIFDVVFHLRCSELNDIAEDISLVELLNCSEEMAQILKKIPERVLFLVDGFDELRLSLPKKPLPVKADIKAKPGAVLSSLLRGCMLNESFLLVTTRSTAAEKLDEPLKSPQRFTEIMGFSESGIQQYFQKFFESDKRSRQVYEEVKANEILYTACSSPVMCWLICSVFKEKSKMSTGMSKSGLRSTTSVFVDFVFILLEHHCQGLTESQQRDLLKDLGQLAHKGILKGRVLFQRNKVPETILNVLDSTSIPFLCTFHYKDRMNVKEMFCFMHLSFQEFFAALLYTFLDETEAELKLKKLLSASLQDGYHLLPVVQFLFGLSNKAVSDLLMEKHQCAVSYSICAQLDKWLNEFLSQQFFVHLSSFALQCLYEVNENYVVKKAMKTWETAVCGIEIYLSSLNTMDYHSAAYCLKFCTHIKSLDLQGCTMENLKMLEKALSKCETLCLSVSHMSDDDVNALISTVGKGKDLQRLSVEDGSLSDESVETIISTLHKHRSVGEVCLAVKNINYTNVETFMKVLKSNVVSEKLRLSLSTKCRNSEENLCSHLELSREHTFSSVEDGSLSDKSVETMISTQHKHRSVGDICLVVKNVYHTSAETFMNFLKNYVVSEKLSLATKYSNSEENLCSDLERSCKHISRKSDEDKKLYSLDVHYDPGESGQIFKTIGFSHFASERSVMSAFDGRKFLQISSHLRKIENTESAEDVDALVSFLYCIPDLQGVNLDVKNLSQKYTAKILSFCHARLAQSDVQDMRIWFNVDSVKDMDEEHICALSLQTTYIYPLGHLFCLDLTAHDWSTLRTQSMESTPELQKISLGFPDFRGGAHVDWDDLIRRLCQMSSSLERCPLSTVLSVPGLVMFKLCFRSLHKNWAVKTLSILQAWESLQNLKFYVESLKGLDEEDICSLSLCDHKPPYMEQILRLHLTARDWSLHQTQSTKSTPVLQEISLGFPYILEGAHVDWEDLLGGLWQMFKSLERYPLSSVLLSVPGLAEVTLQLSSLHESCAVNILAFVQACTSLRYLHVEVDNRGEHLGLVRGNALKDSSNGKVLLLLGCGHLCYTHPEHDEMLKYESHYSHKVAPCITLIMTDNTEIYHIDWKQFFHFHYQLKGQTEHCLEYDQSMNALLSVVKSIPGLKEIRLGLRFLTVDGAFSIFQLMQTCPSLCKIDVTVAGSFKKNVNSSGLWLDSEGHGETNSISSDHSDSSRLTNISFSQDKESDSEINSVSSDHCDLSRLTNSVPADIEHYKLNLCSELKVRRNARNEFKLSLRCNSTDPDTKAVLSYISLILTEYTEESEIDWRRFFQSYYDSKGLTERSPDFDGKVNNILHFLHNMPGLEEVEMGVHSLTETWASHILLLSHENNSIDNICLLLEETNDQDSACSSFTVNRNFTDSRQPSIMCLPSLCASIGCLASCYSLERVTVKIWSVSYAEASPLHISFTVPYSKIHKINGPDLLNRMQSLKFLNENSNEYKEEIKELMSSLHAIPGLQKLKLEIGNLTESWAARILSFSTCPSLKKICVTASRGSVLMEDTILTIQNNWRRRDCVVVLKGLRCNNSTNRCTEENLEWHMCLNCNTVVKLSLCGDHFSQQDGYCRTDIQENLTEEEDEAINQDETHMEQLLRAETLMMTMADEVAAEAINEITSICLEGSEEETVGKHLDYSVSTNDDAAKAIRELLEILHDDALLASVQPLENETVMAMENDEAQAEAAIDEHINLDDAEPYDDRSFGNGIMRDWMISATKSLKAVLGIPLKDIEEEPEDEPLGNEIMRDWKISATKSLKDILGIPPKDTEQDPEKEPEDEPLGNEIMRDWMISATKSLKDILGIPPKDIERDPEKEPEYEPLEKDVISVTEAEAQPEVATDTVPVYMDDTWEPKTHTRTQKGNISPTHTHTHTHTH